MPLEKDLYTLEETATNTSLQDTKSHAVKGLWSVGGVGGEEENKDLIVKEMLKREGGVSRWVTVKKEEGPEIVGDGVLLAALVDIEDEDIEDPGSKGLNSLLGYIQ